MAEAAVSLASDEVISVASPCALVSGRTLTVAVVSLALELISVAAVVSLALELISVAAVVSLALELISVVSPCALLSRSLISMKGYLDIVLYQSSSNGTDTSNILASYTIIILLASLPILNKCSSPCES